MCSALWADLRVDFAAHRTSSFIFFVFYPQPLSSGSNNFSENNISSSKNIFANSWRSLKMWCVGRIFMRAKTWKPTNLYLFLPFLFSPLLKPTSYLLPLFSSNVLCRYRVATRGNYDRILFEVFKSVVRVIATLFCMNKNFFFFIRNKRKK